MPGDKAKAVRLLGEGPLIELILHQLGEGVVVCDAAGRFLFWNQAAERILGKGMTQALPADWPSEYGLFEPQTKKPFPADRIPLTRALRGEATDEVELFVRNPKIPEGAFIKVTGRPIRSLSGRLLGGVVVFRDATAERKAQESLVRLASIVTSSADGILALSPDGRVAECNRAAAVMFGRPERELAGAAVSQLAAPCDRNELARLLSAAAAGKPAVAHVLEFERGRKGRFHGSVTLAPMLHAGRAIGISMIVRDITERKRLEAMREDLIAVASRELRGPATAAQMSLEVALNDLAAGKDPKAAVEPLSSALRNCERLTRLLSECLDVERLREGRSALLKTAPCDLVALLREAIQLNWPMALRSGVTLAEEGLFGEALAVADRPRLLQAVSHLVANAAKFSPPGETVTVSLERHPGSLRISIADHGPGIPQAFRSRIFQRFSRARAPETEKNEGAGLGLSIAREIVERIGGSIAFESAPGRGARFTIDLPEPD